MNPLWLIPIAAFWFSAGFLLDTILRHGTPPIGSPWRVERASWGEPEIALNPGVDYRLYLGRRGVTTLVEGIDHSDLPLPIEFHGEIRWITDFGPDWIDLAKPDFGTVHVKTAADSDPQSDASAPELPSRASPPSDGRSYSGGRDAATPEHHYRLGVWFTFKGDEPMNLDHELVADADLVIVRREPGPGNVSIFALKDREAPARFILEAEERDLYALCKRTLAVPDVPALEHHAAVLEEFHKVLECTCGPHALDTFDVEPTCPLHGWR